MEEQGISELLIDREPITAIRVLERSLGRDDLFAGFVQRLETALGGFGAEFRDACARGDTTGAHRAAHTLKGSCLQLGAKALGELFAQIERSAKAGDYAAAKRLFDGAADLVAQSLEALKRA